MITLTREASDIFNMIAETGTLQEIETGEIICTSNDPKIQQQFQSIRAVVNAKYGNGNFGFEIKE